MKTGKLFVYGGSAALLAVTTLSGCKGPELMQSRAYITQPDQPQQATDTSISPTTATPSAPAATITPNANPADNTPAIQPAAPVQIAQYPAFQPSTSSAPVTSAFQSAEGKTYTIKAGDNLWTIAKHHGVSVEDLMKFNNLNDKSKLQVGKTLRLPPGSMGEGEFTPTVKHKKTDAARPVVATAKKTEKTEKPVVAATKKTEKIEKTEKSETAAAAATADDGKSYTVKKGDFWAKIAKAHHVSAEALAEANKKKTTDTLQIGQKLVIPAAEAKAEGKTTGKSAKKGHAEAVEETTVAATAPETAATEAAPKADAKSAKNAKNGKNAKGAKADAAKTTKTDAAPAKTDDILKGTEDISPNSVANELGSKTVKTKEVDVQEDTTIAQFAAKNGVSVEEIKKHNPQIMDGTLKKGELVTIPE